MGLRVKRVVLEVWNTLLSLLCVVGPTQPNRECSLTPCDVEIDFIERSCLAAATGEISGTGQCGCWTTEQARL